MTVHHLNMLKNNPFFAEISMHVEKRPTSGIDTCGVTYDTSNDCFVMLYNPEWFNFVINLKDKSVEDFGVLCVEGTIKHELYHIVLDHITERMKEPLFSWNAGTDAAINSILVSCGDYLPPGGIVPGTRVLNRDGSSRIVENGSFEEIVQNWPKLKCAEWYFDDLRDKNKFDDEGFGSGKNSMSGEFLDDHSRWGINDDEVRHLARENLKKIVKRAVQVADETRHGWGNIPSEISESIRSFVSDRVDWKTILKNFIGSIVRGSKSSSYKKINKKYPMIHPGTKKSYVPKLAVCIDMSGSVSDELLEAFFSVVSSLTRRVDVTVVPFDCRVDEIDVFEWKKGRHVSVKRTKCGGTSFDAPTDFVNDPKNRSKWDGYVVITDGQAPKPKTSRLKRAWILGPKDSLFFDTDELVIKMTEC